MCKETKTPTTPPDAVEIPPHWAEAMQLQLKNRAVAKEKVSRYVLAHNVQNDQQMIDFIQRFLDETGKRQEEAKFLVGPEGVFQTMVLGLAGIALVDLVLEMVLDGLQKQAAAPINVPDGTQDPGGPKTTQGSVIETTGAVPDDAENDDNGGKTRTK